MIQFGITRGNTDLQWFTYWHGADQCDMQWYEVYYACTRSDITSWCIDKEPPTYPNPSPNQKNICGQQIWLWYHPINPNLSARKPFIGYKRAYPLAACVWNCLSPNCTIGFHNKEPCLRQTTARYRWFQIGLITTKSHVKSVICLGELLSSGLGEGGGALFVKINGPLHNLGESHPTTRGN